MASRHCSNSKDNRATSEADAVARGETMAVAVTEVVVEEAKAEAEVEDAAHESDLKEQLPE